MKGFKYSLAIVVAILLNCIMAYSQTEPAKETKSAKPLTRAEREKEKKQHLKKHIQVYDTSASLIIGRIEDINNTMNDISDIMDNGFDTLDIVRELPPMIKSLKDNKFRIANRGHSMTLRRLSIIQSLLDDYTDQLKDWKTDLFSYSTQLISISSQIGSMTHDSLLRQLPADSALRNMYDERVGELSGKWHSTDSIAKKTLKRINILQSQVSDNYLLTLALQKQVQLLIKTYWQKALGQEYAFIWKQDTSRIVMTVFDTALVRSYRFNKLSLSAYMDSNWNLRILGIALFVVFFIWVWINIRKIKRKHDSTSEILMKLRYIHLFPLKAALVFAFTIAPFLDMHAPGIYAEVLQLILLVVLTVLLALKWHSRQFFYWLVLAVLYEIHCVDGLLVSPNFTPRMWLFIVDVISLVFGIMMIISMKRKKLPAMTSLQPLAIGYCVLASGALVCNVFGRVTLGSLLGNTAIFSFTLAIELMIFIRILLEAVFLQLEAAKKSTRFTQYLNYQNIEGRLKGILIFIASVFWVINLTQNLNLYDTVYTIVSNFLSLERNVGSTTFTFGSVFVFFLIIWLANFLQKYIGYFFGDTSNDETGSRKKIGTSVLLIRLLVLTIGFFLGVAASGLPIDKITIVIGALGVGIGLGLQNIVNQLVSGIILAIERPIQVGDAIDIGGRSGKVKEIGIRSSRLITADGAEIIVPNGDLLSQTITNWTMNNNNVRAEIIVKIGNTQNIDNIKASIASLLNNTDVMQTPAPQILVNSIGKDGFELKILFWVFEISKSTHLKSEILKNIYEKCKADGIDIL